MRLPAPVLAASDRAAALDVHLQRALRRRECRLARVELLPGRPSRTQERNCGSDPLQRPGRDLLGRDRRNCQHPAADTRAGGDPPGSQLLGGRRDGRELQLQDERRRIWRGDPDRPYRPRKASCSPASSSRSAQPSSHPRQPSARIRDRTRLDDAGIDRVGVVDRQDGSFARFIGSPTQPDDCPSRPFTLASTSRVPTMSSKTSPIRSTPCSAGSTTPFRASAASWLTPRTSYARRSRPNGC